MLASAAIQEREPLPSSPGTCSRARPPAPPAGTCPYSDANTRCAATGGRLPDVNAALAADKRVPAIMMYGSGGVSADLLKITPFTDIIKM